MAEILKDISDNSFGKTEVGEPNPHYRQIRTDGTIEPERLSDESKHLWGKNFLVNSEICYEYYLNGLHSSYPDFIMKDKKGRLHLFEVKSVNDSNAIRVNPEEYKDKIRALKECYRQCSKLLDYYFYLPVLKEDCWHITRLYKGNEDTITDDMFTQELSEN